MGDFDVEISQISFSKKNINKRQTCRSILSDLGTSTDRYGGFHVPGAGEGYDQQLGPREEFEVTSGFEGLGFHGPREHIAQLIAILGSTREFHWGEFRWEPQIHLGVNLHEFSASLGGF